MCVSFMKGKLMEFKNQEQFEKFLDLSMVIISIFGFALGFIFTFNSRDYTPATVNDFKPLYEEKMQIENDFSSFLEMDNAKIDIKNKTIILNSEECSLKLTYDTNHTITSVTEVDRYEPLKKIIFISIISAIMWAICLPGAIIIILLIISWFIFFCFEFIKEFIKKEFLN